MFFNTIVTKNIEYCVQQGESSESTTSQRNLRLITRDNIQIKASKPYNQS